MHDAYDGDYIDDSDGGGRILDFDDDDDVDDDGDYGFVDNAADDLDDPDFSSCRPQLNYTILSEEDIRQCQEEALTSISTVLSISRVNAGILLRHFRWSVSKVIDEWFADEANVRKTVGLLEKPVEIRSYVKELSCGICFETCARERMKAAVCGHHFCDTCWAGYIHTSINDGPGCLTLRCPDCVAAVGEDMVFSLVSTEDRKKYMDYLLRSYVEGNRKAKWCPAPGCEYAVEFVLGSGCYDISCKCSYIFCWNCLEEAHRPVACEIVARWISKMKWILDRNSAESENMKWILANSKPCPKCKRPIEKNQGCMHITCTPPCKFEFCWLCLGAWSGHFDGTGGFNACNGYETPEQEGFYDECERSSLEKYSHYYERWASNESSRAKALADLQQMQSVQIEILSDKYSQPVSQLKFVTEAWMQIAECRRVLKWTYAYGYYLPEQEQAKRQFFKYLQGEAESGLERLHQCAEKELQFYLEGDIPSKDFNEFRTKLAGLTSTTRNYFENLVRALENGLSDVNNSQAASSRTSTSKASGGRTGETAGRWSCSHCTFSNVCSTTHCAICHRKTCNNKRMDH